MNKRTICILLVLLSQCEIWGVDSPMGMPPAMSFSSQETHMGNRNYDASMDYDGNVYFANINGVLVYNGVNWHQFYAPNYARVLNVYAGGNDDIWAMGYNNLGRLNIEESTGKLRYIPVAHSDSTKVEQWGELFAVFNRGDNRKQETYFASEQVLITAKSDSVVREERLPETIVNAFYFYRMDGQVTSYLQSESGEFFRYDKEMIQVSLNAPRNELIKCGIELRNGDIFWGTDKRGVLFLSTLNSRSIPFFEGKSVNCIRYLADYTLLVATDNGVYQVREQDLYPMRRISEANGLVGNNIEWLATGPNRIVWCASESGISVIDFSTPYMKYTRSEGIHGEITDVCSCGGYFYVATLDGLFVYDPTSFSFKQFSKINRICWKLYNNGGKLIACTAIGTFEIVGEEARLLDDRQSFSVIPLPDGNGFLCGGYNRLFTILSKDVFYQRLNIPLERAVKFLSHNDNIYIENLNGELFYLKRGVDSLFPIDESYGLLTPKNNHLCQIGKDIFFTTTKGLFRWNEKYLRVEQSDFFKLPSQYRDWYPNYVATTPDGGLYVSDWEEKSILSFDSTGRYLSQISSSFVPLFQNGERVNLIYPEDNSVLWFAMGNLLYRVDLSNMNFELSQPVPKVLIRQITINNEVKFGGFRSFADMNKAIFVKKMKLKSRENSISISFVTQSLWNGTPIKYSYRLVGYDKRWSPWSTNKMAIYKKLSAGNYTFEVKLQDIFNRESEISRFQFSIEQVFFLKWYMLILYVTILAFTTRFIYEWRVRIYKKRQVELEMLISKRTQKVKTQRDEIQLKSHQLQKAMEDLKNTQNMVVQQERMAMVGKLTQGLIDRVLNPVNYIINFSSVTTKFLKELGEVVEDEKDNISEDGYADIEDIGKMMTSNLEKIMGHGQSINRTLRVMEELMSEEEGVVQKLDLNEQIEIISQYFTEENKEDLERYAVKFEAVLPESILYIKARGESLNKMCISMLKNSLYAVKKRRERDTEYIPHISIVLTDKEENVELDFIDDGIGMEETIISKIYDPYFTTKPSADAAGIGLYFVREVVERYQGTISVSSKVNEGCEFKITFPKYKKEE